jgi:hypothetical protein
MKRRKPFLLGRARIFGAKFAVQERYNQNLFLRVLSGPLQGIAVRPLPCNYYVIQYFHGGNTGSNPVGDAKSFQQLTISPPP